jgi:peptide/nickel transport system ATP-binding protein
MANDKETVLELDGLVKTYRAKSSFFGARREDVVALDRVSIDLSRGEIFGLVGESGSGKTTAGRLIVRLEEPEEGRIRLDGREISHLRGRKRRDFSRRVQMIFQDPYQSLNPQLSISDTISDVIAVMKAVGLSPPEDFLPRYPHQLSGGQRQRVAIARAMVLKPEVVVADEPTSMLDASISAQIFNILIEMRGKFDVTILFITHSLAAARYLCDRIGVIYKGSVMEVGPADDVIRHPKHPYTQALIDALPKFGHSGEVRRYGTLRTMERQTDNTVGCPFFRRCEIADELKCSGERPVLASVRGGHTVACFFPRSGFGNDSGKSA